MAEGHDQLFRDLIAAFPADFVRLMLPEAADRMDLAAVEFRQEEYFTDSPRGGRPRRPDLVARAPTHAGGEVGLHVEIEERFRAARLSKLFDYNRLLGLRLALPVHSMVLYCRGGPPGVRERELRVESLGRTLTVFRYRSLGLSRAPAADLLGRSYPLAWALAALADPKRIGRRAELRVACLRKIVGAIHLEEHQRFLLFNFVATYIESDRGAQSSISGEYDELFAHRDYQEVRREMMTWAEKIEAKGYSLGRREGQREGRNEGRKEGEAALLVRMVRKKFGPPAGEIRRRIESGTPEEIRDWSERFVTARCLDEIFA